MPKKPAPIRRPIGDYEGSTIVGSSLKLVGGGTGLNDALTLDSKRFDRNEIVAVLVRGRIKNVGYGDADKDEPEECIEIGTLEIADAAIVSQTVADEMLRAEKERVARARSELDGAQTMLSDYSDDPSLDVVALNNLMKKLTAAGVSSDPDDRQAYYERVLGEHPLVLRQSHRELIEEDLDDGDEIIEADLVDDEDDENLVIEP